MLPQPRNQRRIRPKFHGEHSTRGCFDKLYIPRATQYHFRCWVLGDSGPGSRDFCMIPHVLTSSCKWPSTSCLCIRFLFGRLKPEVLNTRCRALTWRPLSSNRLDDTCRFSMPGYLSITTTGPPTSDDSYKHWSTGSRIPCSFP